MKKLTTPLLLICLIALGACAKKNEPATASKGQIAPAKTAQESKADSAKAALEKSKAAEMPVTRDGITIQKASACRSIENRAPVGESGTFPKDVGRVYVFTQIQKAGEEETSIQHVWNHDGKKVGTVTLPVHGQRWRTYSSKIIDPSWKGDWKVDVTTAKGDVIQSVAFKIE